MSSPHARSHDQADLICVTFDAMLATQFCHWAITRNLDIEDDDDFEDSAGIGFKSTASGAGMSHLRSKAAHRKQQSVASRHTLPQMPEWRRKLAAQRAEANQLTSSIVTASANRAEVARERLARLKARAQRELTRAASLAALEDHKERRRMAVAQVRKESDELVGRDVARRVADVPELSEEEIHSLSTLFNAKLKGVSPDARNFYQLFKELDIDGSRRISFSELERMVRHKLRLNEKKLSEEKLYGLWKALDENASGFIDAGELSRFCRIGAPKTVTPAQAARLAMQTARAGRMAMVRADTQKRLAKDVITKSLEVPRATADEMRELGVLLVKQTSSLRARGHDTLSFYSLFKHMDVDASGRVKFEEFEGMVRGQLKLSTTDMPDEKLWSLWHALDENENGVRIRTSNHARIALCSRRMCVDSKAHACLLTRPERSERSELSIPQASSARANLAASCVWRWRTRKVEALSSRA